MDGNESLTMELLKELKEQNNRLANSLKVSIISLSTIIIVIVGVFIWYLNQYDFSSVMTH